MIRTQARTRVAGTITSLWVRWGLWALMLLALLVMLPRLASPQFGFFDDGVTLTRAHEILEGRLDLANDFRSGRFRPLYWLYYAAWNAIAGDRPFWFFLGNTLLLAATVLVLVRIVERLDGGRIQARITGAVFLLSGPVVENYYTLSKPEALQLLGLLLGILAALPLNRVDAWRTKIGRILAAAACFFLANITKETTPLMIPISAAWLGLAWLRSRRTGGRHDYFAPVGILAASLLSTAAFFVLQSVFLPRSLLSGSYTDRYLLDLGSILDTTIRWTGWMIRDFPHIFMLIPLLVWVGIVRRRLPQPALLAGALVWSAAWIAIYLPWVFTIEYYMLPLAAGMAVLCGVILAEALAVGSEAVTGAAPAASPAFRWAAAVLAALAAVLFLMTLANNLTNARIQLAVDRANDQLMDYLADELPAGSALWVNIQDPNEYVEELDLHLRALHARSDVTIRPYQGGALQPGAFVALPEVQNQLRLSVRMGVYEPTQRQWNDSLAGPLQEARANRTFETEQAFRMASVDLPRLFCPLMRGRGYCAEPGPLLDRRTFRYGWKVYQAPESPQGVESAQPGERS